MKHFIDGIPIRLWTLLKGDKVYANVVWKYTKERVYCSMCVWNDSEYSINYSKVAYAGGYGYCKFSASFANLMELHGFKVSGVSGYGERAVEDWLEKTFIGTKVVRLI